MFDLTSEILQTIRNNKLRTSLTGLSVAWGIFMLITLVAIANGVVKDFSDDMMTPENQKMNIYSGITTKPYKGYRDGRTVNLKNQDMATLRSRFSSEVTDVTSEIAGPSTTMSYGTKSVSISYSGVSPIKEKSSKIDMWEGRFINEKDMAEKNKSVVIPQKYAKELFPPDGEDAIGKHVNIGGLAYVVVGVYADRWRRDVYIPYYTAQMFTEDKSNINSMTVQVADVTSSEQAESLEKGFRATLAGIHDFDPSDQSGVFIWNSIAQLLTVNKGMGILSVSVWVLGLLTLLSGIIGISNIMFVSVKERTHEIGIRRAIGAKPRKILTQILAESVAITTIFGYIGIVLGMVLTGILATLMSEMFGRSRVDIAIAVEVTVVLIIAGALAGLFPALKALKIKPVEALRDE